MPRLDFRSVGSQNAESFGGSIGEDDVRIRETVPASPRRLGWAGVAIVAAGVLLSSGVSPGLSGQTADLSRVHEGDSVKVLFPGSLWVGGSFAAWRADVMLIQTRGVAGNWPVPVLDLVGMQVHTLRTPREGFRHGAMLGAMTGVFVGAAIGAVLHATGVIDQPGGSTGEIVSDTLKWTGLGLAFGTIAGGFYGAAHPGSGWVEVHLPVF